MMFLLAGICYFNKKHKSLLPVQKVCVKNSRALQTICLSFEIYI